MRALHVLEQCNVSHTLFPTLFIPTLLPAFAVAPVLSVGRGGEGAPTHGLQSVDRRQRGPGGGGRHREETLRPCAAAAPPSEGDRQVRGHMQFAMLVGCLGGWICWGGVGILFG